MKKLPLMTEVFLIEKDVEAPSVSAPVKSTPAGKKPFTPKPIRGVQHATGRGVPEGDPFKDTGPAEHFAAEHGDYCMFKGGGQTEYHAHYVDSHSKKVEDLGSAPSRAAMIDIVLAHHDKKAAGL